MRRRVDGLAVVPQLLVQLLARPRADELDRDVALGLLAREADHVPREVDDADRLAHVEDVDVARPPIAPAWTTSDEASGIVMK